MSLVYSLFLFYYSLNMFRLAAFLQPRHIPSQGYNITLSSAPDDGHMVARNMLSN